MDISREEGSRMLAWARKVIESKLENREAEAPDFSNYPPCGAFVTLHKQGTLRGCIGYTISHEPLEETIRDAALSAAFRDPRFNPVSEEELPEISLEISLLTPPEEISSPEQLELGVHGALIKSAYSTGLFLPQVAPEQGWNKDEFMDNLCLKAGLPRNHWRTGKYKLFRFSALIFSE